MELESESNAELRSIGTINKLGFFFILRQMLNWPLKSVDLTPRYAQFRVPLSFNKFDLRSYLWHLYGVGVLGIRSLRLLRVHEGLLQFDGHALLRLRSTPRAETLAIAAQFRVPLSFNKFDLRSYLWHLYGVGVLGIRSYVQAQPGGEIGGSDESNAELRSIGTINKLGFFFILRQMLNWPPPKYEWPKLGKPVYLYVAQNLLCSTKTASQQI
jgi:hypothetical protein